MKMEWVEVDGSLRQVALIVRRKMQSTRILTQSIDYMVELGTAYRPDTVSDKHMFQPALDRSELASIFIFV